MIYKAAYTESSWRMYIHCRRSFRSQLRRVYPPPTAAEGEHNRTCPDCRAATTEAELVLQIRLGGGFDRNSQDDTVLDYCWCKFLYNRHFYLGLFEFDGMIRHGKGEVDFRRPLFMQRENLRPASHDGLRNSMVVPLITQILLPCDAF